MLGLQCETQGFPKRVHSSACRMRIETALRAENPETFALVRRDERHVKWAEAEAQTAEIGMSSGTPGAAEDGLQEQDSKHRF